MALKKLHLLFITKDWSMGLERNTFYLMQSLKQKINVTIWGKPGDLNTILSTISNPPDFILLNDLRPTRCPEIINLHNCNIPIGMIMHDLHYKINYRKDFIKKNNIKYLFVHYRDAFKKNYKEFEDRMIWFPHYIDPSIFKDYHEEKSIDFLMMGCAYPNIYPLRDKILKTLSTQENFIYHDHPGYEHTMYDERYFIVGKRYAQEINKSKIFLTCDSIYHYPLMKYFEVLATNTLLLAPHSQELQNLGFIPNQHFININEYNYAELANQHLQTYDTLGKYIAKNGYEMIHKYHTVEQRSVYLINIIQKISSGGKYQHDSFVSWLSGEK
ncbi:glycosyltransferase [Bacillus cereus]|uniref:glycosyltransferase family protein n=1 Tax=Bacillus cereus TaxID=1396 RepID=UPI00211843F1|nr:glycosyltransferase [Bacillus cereus]